MNTPAVLVMNGNDSASAADAQRGVALIRSRLPHRPLTAASPASLTACDVLPETCPPEDRGAKPAHLAQMPWPRFSLLHFCFQGSIILACQFACSCLCCLLSSVIQTNKVASLLYFVASQCFFLPPCLHKQYFYLILFAKHGHFSIAG